MFKFKLGWFSPEGFFGIMKKVWTSEEKGSTPMQRWQNEIRRLRQFLRAWAKSYNGNYKKEKQELFKIADELDRKDEA